MCRTRWTASCAFSLASRSVGEVRGRFTCKQAMQVAEAALEAAGLPLGAATTFKGLVKQALRRTTRRLLWHVHHPLLVESEASSFSSSGTVGPGTGQATPVDDCSSRWSSARELPEPEGSSTSSRPSRSTPPFLPGAVPGGAARTRSRPPASPEEAETAQAARPVSCRNRLCLPASSAAPAVAPIAAAAADRAVNTRADTPTATATATAAVGDGTPSYLAAGAAFTPPATRTPATAAPVYVTASGTYGDPLLFSRSH